MASYAKISRRFLEDYFRTYDTCCRVKVPRHHPYGWLEPSPIPRKPWQSISLDFITDLTDSKGFNVILTVVDRYTKMAHLVPVLKKSLVKKPQELLCVKYFGIMVFPIVSSVIVTAIRVKILEASLQNSQCHLQPFLRLSSPNRWTRRTYQ